MIGSAGDAGLATGGEPILEIDKKRDGNEQPHANRDVAVNKYVMFLHLGMVLEMTQTRVIHYAIPTQWIRYDRERVFSLLAEAKGLVVSLTSTPFQRDWVEKLQAMQLKMEVAGTSRIEGAEFTENELDAAIRTGIGESAEAMFTRSQRQAAAATSTYRWIAGLPDDLPITAELVKDVHRRIITGCDDDHCEPGSLRKRDVNVIFGAPPHRGCEGGDECERAFSLLIGAVQTVFKGHDPLIQALAFHYHLAAMHPFLDGNGRTARALEALVLQRAGLRDTAFIAMSNYYYDEKATYLATLADVRASDDDLTDFLLFGLAGIASQCRRLYSEIRRNMQRALFRNTMYDMFSRLKSTRTRVIRKRQLEILNLLLRNDELDWYDFVERISPQYAQMKSANKALMRDVGALAELGAITFKKVGDNRWVVSAHLDWPSEVTETRFFATMKNLPRGKTYSFLR